MASGIYPLAGSSIVIENLADRLGKKGVEVTIGALIFKRTPPNGPYNITPIPMSNALKLRRYLKKFDVVHNHHPLTNYLALLNNNFFIYHYHGAPDLGSGYLYRASMLSSIKITSHRFDAVIAVSESGAAELKQNFDLENVHVVYNGVDTGLFKPGLEEKFRKGTPQFLFVGNLYQHKNVEELIFAFKGILKNYPNAYLQIVGNGFMYERLKNIMAELGLENDVELVGCVPDFELPYYYASCDVYVTASRWELFGLPLLEAMACGKPVVASSIPPHVELLTKSKAGEIYIEGDAEALCRSMIKIYEERECFRSKAVDFAKLHDWIHVTDRIIKIYSMLE
jgi:glycosyltransferase involved in cell wall biosynthesis